MTSLYAFAKRIAMRGEVPHYQAAYAGLERWFQCRPDPWNFGRDRYDTVRFDGIIDAVQRVPHDSILEIGCAEGHLTRRLCDVAKTVVAIDVSPTAVARAQRAAPKATIIHGQLEEVTFNEMFDLVVCSEAIYYPKDTSVAIRKLNSLGHFVLVTYSTWEGDRLDPLFSTIPSRYTASFRYVRPFDSGRILNWRGSRLVLWKSGAWDGSHRGEEGS
jgi:SAM-dependent methyltransferase